MGKVSAPITAAADIAASAADVLISYLGYASTRSFPSAYGAPVFFGRDTVSRFVRMLCAKTRSADVLVLDELDDAVASPAGPVKDCNYAA